MTANAVETLVVIGWPGARKCYRDVPSEEALGQFIGENQDGFDSIDQVRAYGLVKEYHFAGLRPYFEMGFYDAQNKNEPDKTTEARLTKEERHSYYQGYDAFVSGLETEVL